MKKKLLTVLLAVVMVFGVFGLTACGGSNPDEEYNYYASKYAIEDEIKIDAVTYQAVYRMFTGGGKYLLYIDSEDTGAKERFQAINKLANDWNVTIYHFNPDLSGGFAKSTDPTANLLADFTKEANKLAAKSEIVKLQDTLNTITAGGWKSVKDHQLLGINATAYATEVDYADAYAGRQSVMDAQQAMQQKAVELDTAIATEEARVEAAEGVVEAAKAALEAAKAADPVVAADVAAAEKALEEAEAKLEEEKAAVDAAKAAFNKAMADITKAEDALAAAAVNVYYGSKGYSGWVSPITAADYDKAEKAIAAISVKQPSYGKYTDEEKDVPYIPEAYNTSAINTMNLFGDARLHLYDDQDAFNAEKEDVFVTLANYAMFEDLMLKNDGYFAVFFGGTWCPNTQAIVYHVNKLAKDYGISKVYFFDPKLDDGTKIDTHKVVENEDGTFAVETKVYGANLTSNMNTRTGDTQTAGKGTDTTADDKYTYSNCYNFLYARFLDTYLNEYWSEWNITSKLIIGASNADGKEYAYTDAAIHTRMCVPNMMMFNGEGEGKAKLVGLCEAEYTWANTSVEGSAENVNWIEAVKGVFDENPYASYAPIFEAEEEAADSSSASSAPAAKAPAADAGGC